MFTGTARLSPQSFRRFAEFIGTELGIKMAENKLPMLQSRLQRRLRALQLPDLEAYQARLFDPADRGRELTEFIDAVTTNKTDFLREPAHFDYLTGHALPALDPNPAADWRVRVWCAGCSSGEEPYTLAMVLSEYGAQRGRFDFKILGTDISTRVLQHAQNAVYDESRIEPVPPAWRTKYLLRSRNAAWHSIRIAPELRERVEFARLNFMHSDYGVKELFDVVFFRNVMIYFDRPTQQAVVNRLCRQLRRGGYFFTGHSESLVGLQVPLRLVGPAVYQKPHES